MNFGRWLPRRRSFGLNLLSALFLTGVALLAAHLTVPLGQWGVMTLPGDAAVFSYILAWGAHAIFHCPLSYYDAPIFFPLHTMLPSTDGLELPALLASPAWYLSKNPVFTYNFATFLSHVFCLLAGYYAVRVVLRLHRAWCVLLAVVFAITSDRFWHSFGHLNLMWSGILPIVFAQVWAALEHKRRRDAVWLGIAFGASIYFSVYLFVLSALTIALAAALWLVSRLRLPGLKLVGALLLAGVLGLVIAAPKILVYKHAAERNTQTRGSTLQASYYSASAYGYLQPTYRPNRLESNWYKVLPAPKEYRETDEDQQFLGYLLGLLLLIESIRVACRAVTGKLNDRDRLSAAALVSCVVLAVCSFGPHFRIPLGRGASFSPYLLLYETFIKHTQFYRVPARLAFVVEWLALLPVGVLLLNAGQLPRLYRWAYSFCGIILVLFEHAPAKRPIQFQWDRLTLFDKMDELDPSRRAPVVALDPYLSLTYCALSNTGHWRPLVNGWSSSPLGKSFDDIAGHFSEFPTPTTLAWLAKNHVRFILVIDPAQKVRAEASDQLRLIESAQGINLMEMRDPDAIVSAWRSETEEWQKLLAAQRATIPPVHTWPKDDLLKLAGGDHLRKNPDGTAIIRTTETTFASLVLDLSQALAPGVWDEIQVSYKVSNPSDHNVKIYWKDESHPMSEDRSIEGTVTKPGAGSDIWTAKLRPGVNGLWLSDKTLHRIRLDFHSFADGKPAEVEVLSVRLSRDAKQAS